jgi:hypothetical protein
MASLSCTLFFFFFRSFPSFPARSSPTHRCLSHSLIDSDTRIPKDCFLDAACEMSQSPEVGVLQHQSGTFLAGAGYFENYIVCLLPLYSPCMSLTSPICRRSSLPLSIFLFPGTSRTEVLHRSWVTTPTFVGRRCNIKLSTTRTTTSGRRITLCVFFPLSSAP